MLINCRHFIHPKAHHPAKAGMTRVRILDYKDRVYVDHINEPISISGVQVCPGDLICADNTGVVVVPFKRAEEVLKVAHEIEAVEQQIMAKIEAGMTLKEARQQTGYHKLQTPED